MNDSTAIAALLAKHARTTITARWNGSPDPSNPRNIKRVCSCGEVIPRSPYPSGYFKLGGDAFDEPHRLHIAEVLAS